MDSYIKSIQIRWADLDPNFHLRHSVYYDWGAMVRMEFLEKQGLTTALMKELKFGPVILREECVFKREIHYGDAVTLDTVLVKAKKDYSRWTFRHHIVKNEATLSAILTLEGAWINTELRKLFIPPAKAAEVFSTIPLAADFSWMD